jgi:hypothetical protein
MNFRSPFASALTPAVGWRWAHVPPDPAHGRTLGTTDGLALIPVSNRDNRPQRKPAALAPWGRPHRCLRLGCAKALAQRPAKWRDSSGGLSLGPKILRSRRLVGGGSSPARTRLCTPNSLIYGKIQGIRADSGSAGVAIGTDSLARTSTCAPHSLETETGNFVLRSRDSRGHDLPQNVPDSRDTAPLRSVRSQAPQARLFFGALEISPPGFLPLALAVAQELTQGAVQ